MVYSEAKQQKLSSLIFDPGRHVYSQGGILVPGVTSVISSISGIERIPADILKVAADRGTIVHQVTEGLDAGQLTCLDQDLVDAGLDGYARAWEAFKQDMVKVVLLSEQLVYHTRYRYAGTMDRLVELHDGKFAVVDIKSGEPEPTYALQTAAYLEAFNEEWEGPQATERLTVHLRPNGRYGVKRYDDQAGDFACFRALLVVYNWLQRTR